MQTLRTHFFPALFALCLLSAAARAQTQSAASQHEHAPVTATAAADRVRFSAPNRVARLRLEVLSPAGDVLFESSTRGSVLDWTLSDSQGARLPDGAYLCVLTVKDVSGRITQRLSLVELGGGVAAARPAAASDLTPRQAEAVGPVEGEAAGVVGADEQPSATLLAHDGTDGQLVTTSGDLSFRGGDFFTGRDKELMRLSRDGSLEVTGSLLARGGIRFPDGTVLHSAQGAGRAGGKGEKAGASAADGGAVTPSATVGRLAKFLSADGSLADSVIFEDAEGNIGVGTNTPGGVFDVRRVSSSDILQRVWNAGAGGAKLRYVAATGATSQLQLTDGTGWLMAIAGNRNTGLQFRVRGSEQFNTEAGLDASTRMTIVSNGNVGIGTTTPAHRLDVAGNVRVAGAGNGIIFPDGSKQTSAAAGAGGLTGSGTAGTVPLWTAANLLGDSVITQSNTNVGIGVAAPAYKLQVAGGAGGGVSGSATGGGFALFGSNPSGWAVGADGNTRQNRDRGGWVKAMIYVNETGAITRCFNSFAADGGASQAGCGFTVSHTSATGVYLVGFPFAVNDRFYSLAAKAASTTEQPRLNVGANYELDVNPNSLVVSTYLTSGAGTQTADASFILIIY